ncbi:MAG: hypothetical protein EXR27_14415 [Betaproteobacteria bacterium]|nr:hypothetical protein [Betaproteobacteria bacterium]
MDLKNIGLYVDDRPAEGVFRVHRDVYADPALFELEMRFIFERTWVFLGIESQIPKANDFITASIGRTPVLVTRKADGGIGAFINVCRHKGARVCRAEQGNAKYHVCAYHGWAYDSGGKNIDIKDRGTGAYPAGFDSEDHNLLPLARVAAYKGIMFGSLSADVPSLDAFLGDMRFFIDLAMDQGPQGMEFVPGRVAYTYRGNWKLQLDNGLDAYHLTSTHSSFMDVQTRRRSGEGHQAAQQYDWTKRGEANAGNFSFPYGHSNGWLDQPEPQKRQIYPLLDEVRARVGNVRAEWMLKLRQTALFPNMQIADGSALMLRLYLPLAVDRTEMRGYCLAPIGERPDLRAWRLRQFEDFFNPGGLATPDDSVIYEECQNGFGAQPLSFMQGYSRGTTALQQGADDDARTLGISPLTSARGRYDMFNEVGLHAPYREWARLMEAGLSGGKSYP